MVWCYGILWISPKVNSQQKLKVLANMKRPFVSLPGILAAGAGDADGAGDTDDEVFRLPFALLLLLYGNGLLTGTLLRDAALELRGLVNVAPWMRWIRWIRCTAHVTKAWQNSIFLWHITTQETAKINHDNHVVSKRGWSCWVKKNNASWFIEGSLEVKLPTIWTDGKAEVGRVREEKKRSEKIREEKEWEERIGRCAKR